MFNIHIEFERWKFNKEYNLYVSTLGRVKDSNKRIVNQMINSGGYFVIQVKEKLMSVHSLVMHTFRGKKAEGMTIDHINSNRRDNRLKNLEYVTKEENLNRANTKLILDKESKVDVSNPNELLNLLVQHNIYSAKELNDVLKKNITEKKQNVKNISKKVTSMKRIVAKDSDSWARKFLQVHNDRSVADLKTFSYRVGVYAKLNKEYCGYRLSIINNEIIGESVC